MSRFDYLIIGNSAAAIGAVEAIREADLGGTVAIVSDEPHLAYSRPRISECITKRLPADSMLYRDADFYEAHSIELFLGVRAQRILPERKVVVLEDGAELSYGRLLLATGSRPAKPPIPGIDIRGVHYFTTFEQADELAESLDEIRRVVVIGGGLIGLQAAEALWDAGKEVTIVEMLERVLAQSVDERASSLVEAQFAKHGICIRTSTSVEEILGSGRVSGVRLSDDSAIDCEAVVVAVGVTPRKELAEEAGLTVNRGIVVNDLMQTSDPDIYAAGDVAETRELVSGERRLLPIWPNAYAEGRTAGLAMAGRPEEYPGGIPVNACHFFGFPVLSAGVTANAEGCSDLVQYDGASGYYRRIVLRNNVPIGMVMAGDAVDRAGLITHLIRMKTDAGAFLDKICCPHFNSAHLPYELRQSKQLGRENE